MKEDFVSKSIFISIVGNYNPDKEQWVVTEVFTEKVTDIDGNCEETDTTFTAYDKEFDRAAAQCSLTLESYINSKNKERQNVEANRISNKTP